MILGDGQECLSHNGFVYCKNNPVIMVDPTGFYDIPVDLGGGWFYRIDSPNETWAHITVYNKSAKKGYWAQNADGSIHDKHKNTKGGPPKWIKKELIKREDWDWDKKHKSYYNKIDLVKYLRYHESDTAVNELGEILIRKEYEDGTNIKIVFGMIDGMKYMDGIYFMPIFDFTVIPSFSGFLNPFSVPALLF